jgi:hypothetical protein
VSASPKDIAEESAVSEALANLFDWRSISSKASRYENPWRSDPGYGDPWSGDSPSEASSHEAFQRKVHEYIENLQRWETKVIDSEARRRYQRDVETFTRTAQERAEKAVGKVDVGVLKGRGPQFMLQFTTVVIIILSTLVLGILERLDAQQAGTILAAISGYVLGQSVQNTATTAQVPKEQASADPPQAKS